MLNRKVSVVVCAWLSASVAAFGQASGSADVFQVAPASSGSGSQLLGFDASANNFTTPLVTIPGSPGTFQIIAKPDGTKFYFVSASSVQAADPGFVNFRMVNGIPTAPNSVAITPNGKYLLIGAGMPNGVLYIVDTSTDQVVANISPLSAQVVQQYGIAISQDSTRAFVLANNAFQQATIIAVDLTTFRQIGANSLTLTGQGSGIAFSPLNLLYVTAGNRVYEIDPSTVALTASGEIDIVAADPGPPRFTPDGTTLYCVNHNPAIGGRSIIRVTLQNHAVADWPPFNSPITPPFFDDVYIAGNSRIFAWSSQTATLYDVNPTSLSATTSSLNSVVSATNVGGIAVSTELPSARYLFLEIASGTQISLNRVDLTSNALLTGLSTVGAVPLVYVAVPAISGPGAFIQYNNLQTLTAGATSLPLAALVLDSAGRPVYNQPVTFATDPANGAVINSPTATTNANGYVQTTVTVPKGAAGSVFTITLTAGTASTTFTLTVPGVSGGGGPGAPSQVTIVSGDGQVIYPPNAAFAPMIVKVTDVSGMPLANVPVTFATASASVNLTNQSLTTDSNGMASANFSIGPPPSGAAYLANTITATTSFGTVSFTETSVPSQPNCSLCPRPSPPDIALDAPMPNRGWTLQVPAGGVLSNAAIARIHATGTPQISMGSGPVALPGVGISLVNSENDLRLSPAAYCQGDPLSDQNGMVHCDLVGQCLAVGTSTGASFSVGNSPNGLGFFGTIVTVQGAASQVQKISGDNQSGRPGQQLPLRLLALVTDGCKPGTPIAGAQVQWQVIQGSATLTGATSVSDSAGRVSTQLIFGQTPGQVQVRLSLPGLAQTVFTLTNQVVVASVNVASGNNQTVFTNQPFPQPLVVSVLDNNNNPVPGITVNFSIGSGSGSAAITATDPATDAQGHQSATISAGAASGSVTIIASYGAFSATFTLMVQLPGPAITATSFLSAAYFGTSSSGPPGLAPCGLATVTGPGLAPNLKGAPLLGGNGFEPLPNTLGGVSITVSGVPAPIQSVANQNGVQSVTFQTPCEVPPGTATVIVQVSGGSTTVSGVAVFAAAPAVFNYPGPGGKAYAAVIDANTGNYVTPSNPAHPGGTYYVYVTGLGQASPAIGTNSSGTVGTAQMVNLPVIVGVNGAGVPVVFAQYAAGYIGVYIVGFQIPPDAPTGTDQPFAVGVQVDTQVVLSNATYLPAVN